MKSVLKYHSLLIATLALAGAQAALGATDHNFTGVLSTYDGAVYKVGDAALNWTFTDTFTFDIASGFSGLAGDAMGGMITLRSRSAETTITGLSVSSFGALADANSDLSDGFQFSLASLTALTPYTVTVSGSVASSNLPTKFAVYDVQAIAAVPEPSGYGLALAGIGVLGVAGTRSRRRRG